MKTIVNKAGPQSPSRELLKPTDELQNGHAHQCQNYDDANEFLRASDPWPRERGEPPQECGGEEQQQSSDPSERPGGHESDEQQDRWGDDDQPAGQRMKGLEKREAHTLERVSARGRRSGRRSPWLRGAAGGATRSVARPTWPADTWGLVVGHGAPVLLGTAKVPV